MMSSRPTAERPPRYTGHTGLGAGKTSGGSYVQRYKIQKERIKALHNKEEDQHSGSDKTLPKIPQYAQQVVREDRDSTGVRKFTRSDTIKSIKLPGVSSGSAYAQAARQRQPVPLKTFHLRLNPELSKSLNSLPSIPGSPSLDHGVSPLSERQYEFKASAFPIKHRYQKIAFQKTLHNEKTSLNANDTSEEGSVQVGNKDKRKDHFESVYKNVMPRRAHRHIARLESSEQETSRSHDDSAHPKSNSTLSHARYRRHSKDHAISDTRSEGNYFINKKWKENCDCLRCQMLKRQFNEGDEHYSLWGQYPCHKVDVTIGLDED